MTDNAYLKIAQDKGLIDQDDYQGWRLTGKGEKFLALILDDEQSKKYQAASRRLFHALDWHRAWGVTGWRGACVNDHPGQIKVVSLEKAKVPDAPSFTCWVSIAQAMDQRYDIAQVIAGQYESALRQAAEGQA